MRSALVALFALCVAGCSSESSHVREARNRFFSAVAQFDYSGVRDAVSPDYVLVQGGRILNLDSLLTDMQRLEDDSGSASFAFDDSTLRVEPPIAWMTYRARRILAHAHRTDTLHRVESAIFRRNGGGWKLALLHSTPEAAAAP